MIKSLRKNYKGILLMLISSICVCVGQLLWKLSIGRSILLLLIGFGFYALGALIMIVAYRFGSLSVLQPMLSLNYILSAVLAYAVLHEKISLVKGIGIVVIIFGVVLIGGGDE